MYLIYTDETGTNIGDNSSRFLFYGGLIVHESKLNTLELQLENIVAQFLGLDNLVEVELHTTEIFNYLLSGKEPDKKAKKEKFEAMKEKIEGKTLDDFANFIEELIQFLNKINIPLKVSLVDKEHKIHNIHRISKEASCNAYSFKIFLNMVDKFLSSKNEMGLLIADSFDGQLKKELKNADASGKRINNEVKIRKNEIEVELKNQYQLLIQQDNILLLAENNLNILENKLTKGHVQFNVGNITKSNLDSLTNEVENQKSRIEIDRNNLFKEIEKYKAMVAGMI